MTRLLLSSSKLKTILVVTLSAVVVSGCSSLRGAPEPVFNVADSNKILRNYEMTEAIESYRKKDDENEKQAYRNEVIFAYVQAIDARYFGFRRAISSEGRGSKIGFDTLSSGITGAGTIAAGAAQELSAIATALGGIRGSIDKNLLFEQTLPALFAAMEAERLKAYTNIVRRMKLSTAEYPLTAAFADINQYQIAGSLAQAVSVVTDEAAKERSEAKSQFERELQLSCDAQSANRALTQRLGNYNNSLVQAINKDDAGRPEAERKMRIISEVLELSPTTNEISDVNQANMSKINSEFCSTEELEGLIKKIEMMTGDEL